MGTYIKLDTSLELTKSWIEGPTPNKGDVLTFGSFEDRTIETYEVVSIHRTYKKSKRERGELDLKSDSSMGSPSIVIELKKLHERKIEPQELNRMHYMVGFIPFSEFSS